MGPSAACLSPGNEKIRDRMIPAGAGLADLNKMYNNTIVAWDWSGKDQDRLLVKITVS